MLSAPVCRKDDDKADKVNDINLAAVTPPSVNSVRVNFSRDTIPAAPKRVPSETPRVAKMKPTQQSRYARVHGLATSLGATMA